MVVAAVAMPGVALAATSRQPRDVVSCYDAPQTVWPQMPSQVAVTDGLADIGDVQLAYWDTGGTGEVVILLHPRTGSRDIWGYQLPVLAAAGYRVVAYSRRSHAGSGLGPPDDVKTGLRDFIALVDQLQIGRFHLVGSAAGGFIVTQCAVKYPERLLSITIACSLSGISDTKFVADTAKLTPKEFRELPPAHRELGPSFRHANPAGVTAWLELYSRSLSGPSIVRQPPAVELSWEAIESIRTPTLLITGDADPYIPPSRLREVAKHFANAQTLIVREAGHSAYWEQPKVFNRAVLEFIEHHRELARGGLS